MYPTISIFGWSVQTYYVCAALAGLTGAILSYISLRKILSKGQAVILPVLVLLSALIGARLLNYFTNPSGYDEDFHLWTISYRKLSLMGGLALGVFTVILFGIISRKGIFKLLDAFVYPAAAGIILLKLGCFLNGCCFGIPTDSPFGMVFPANEPIYRLLDSIPLIKAKSPHVHPTQLYEIAGALLAVIIAWLLPAVLKMREGSRAMLFAALFAACRWIVLPLRELNYPDYVTEVLYPLLYAFVIAAGIGYIIYGLIMKNRYHITIKL